MRRDSYAKGIGIWMVGLLLLLSPVIDASAQAQQRTARNAPFPALQLPVPQNEMESIYLGVPESGTFRVGDVKAQVVLIEILSVYCPYCQRVAPLLNEVYERIEKDPGLKGKIKIIGVGMSNSPYELNMFKEKFKVPFPLFPDANSEISKKFDVPGTPTFIGVKVDGKGAEQEVFYKPGAFKDASQFLADLTKAAGLK
jgi:thiol-disulfide isomerase/thioredoxin